MRDSAELSLPAGLHKVRSATSAFPRACVVSHGGPNTIEPGSAERLKKEQLDFREMRWGAQISHSAAPMAGPLGDSNRCVPAAR